VTGKSHQGSVEGFINLPKLLEVAIGTDNTIFEIDDDIASINTYDDLFQRLLACMEKTASIVTDVSVSWDTGRAQTHAGGFVQSLTILDCIENCKGYMWGGARYNACNWNIVGLANLADSLMAIKYLVFQKSELSLEDFVEILKADWQGYNSRRFQILRDIPHYGNDNDEVDEIAVEIVTGFSGIFKKYSPYRGGEYVLGTLPGAENMHITFGKTTGATPDGRRKGEPLADTIGPAQGRDRNGPTSMLNSVSKLDHTLMPGAVTLNLKINPKVVADDDGVTKVADLILTHFTAGGQQVQFNMVTKEDLLKAKENPSEYGNIFVRVVGYSAPFNSLGPELQDEIIARTEYSIV